MREKKEREEILVVEVSKEAKKKKIAWLPLLELLLQSLSKKKNYSVSLLSKATRILAF